MFFSVHFSDFFVWAFHTPNGHLWFFLFVYYFSTNLLHRLCACGGSVLFHTTHYWFYYCSEVLSIEVFYIHKYVDMHFIFVVYSKWLEEYFFITIIISLWPICLSFWNKCLQLFAKNALIMFQFRSMIFDAPFSFDCDCFVALQLIYQLNFSTNKFETESYAFSFQITWQSTMAKKRNKITRKLIEFIDSSSFQSLLLKKQKN